MSVTPKTLIRSQTAPNAIGVLYTAPGSKFALIDKFTATNLDASSQTITVCIVPVGGSPGDGTNTIVSVHSISTGATADLTELKNHVLETGEAIAVVASIGLKVVVRASGREVSA